MKNSVSQGKAKKILRMCCIVFISLNSILHLLGGIGTVCVAVSAEKYGAMAVLKDYKWLYKIFVLTAIAVGIGGIKVTVELIKRKYRCYRNAIIILIAGTVVCGAHMLTSEILRGDSTPVNVRFYFNLLTLIIFILSKNSGLWTPVSGTGGEGRIDEASAASGAAMIVSGVMVMTVQMWAGPVHTINGVNYADVWHWQVVSAGGALVVCGLFVISRVVMKAIRYGREKDCRWMPLKKYADDI